MFKGLSLKVISKTLALAGLAIIVYLLLAMLFTNWFTKHGESVKVPDVMGMSAEKALTVLEDSDLEMIIIDSVYQEDLKPMTIVEQDPLPEMNVKPGRLIYLIINTGIKPQVKMPSLKNGSANLAIVLLQNSGLKLGRVDSVSSTLGSGLVIRQKYKGKDIEANTMLEKGSIIDIVISKKVSSIDTSASQGTNTTSSEDEEL
jgi:beta-lactam-binding protein with PASTA domain